MASEQGVEHDFEQAFEVLFTRAYRLALRVLGDRSLAEDVAAEALARAYARWPRVRELPHRDGWVLKVASNLAIDATRRRRPDPYLSMAPDQEEAAVLRTALSVALRSLPKRQRQVIVLHFLSDLSEAEVAAVLGISPNTVKTHVHRGIAALRRRLGSDFPEDSLALAHG